MVNLKHNLVRVRCLECSTTHSILMQLIGSEKEQRSLSFEYEHIFRGELTCEHCNTAMRLLTTVYEYPKGIINYIEQTNQACLILDAITEESLTIE